MRAALKRWRYARRQRDLEASLFGMGGYGAWQRVRRVNDLTGVWRHQRARNRAHAAAWILAAVALFTVPVLVSCSSHHGPDRAACRAALVQQWKEALGNPTTVTPGTEPAPCKGLDAATLQALWTQAGTEAFG
jgi:hypothetical protein